jgi:hypothetical protein
VGGRFGFLFFFLEVLYSLSVRQGDVNRMYWILSKRSKFEVRSCYHVLTKPSRLTFFVWVITLGKILNLDNLRKRNVIVVD